MGEQSHKPNPTEPDMKGWLYKWTNYIKGYQKRWFVLTNGLLSYYRSPSEMAHTCRGTISLKGASITTEDSCNFIISTCGTQTWHLKAGTEVLRQRWVTSLELAKHKTLGIAASDDDEEDMEMDEMDEAAGVDKRVELEAVLRLLNSKLEDLKTCQDMVVKQGTSLVSSLQNLESLFPRQPDGSVEAASANANAAKMPGEIASIGKTLSERATLFKITCTAMINACREYADLANAQGRKWQRLLHHERAQRLQLEDMVETLARQHSHLEQSVVQEHRDSKNKPHHHKTGRGGGAAGQGTGDGKGGLEVGSGRAGAGGSAGKEGNEVDVEVAGNGAQDHAEFMGGRRAGPPVTNLSDSDDNEMEFFDALEENEEEFIVQIGKRAGGSHKSLSGLASDTGALSLPSSEARSSSTPSSRPETPPKVGGDEDGAVVKKSTRKRRTCIPDRPNISLNLWSIMKNCIGKELTKIPMPVNFSEPLSLLQRLTEEYEYSYLLDEAARCTDPCEQLTYIAAFTISSFASTSYRTGKPFNPLLGETYEWDRTEDLGWKVVSEQVSHHPPIAAQHASGRNWDLNQDFSMSSKFRGKYLQIVPMGSSHLYVKSPGIEKPYYYTWRKVNTTVHNIIVGKLWVDNHGEMDIVNHTTGDKCHLKFIPYSYFSRDVPRRVTGYVTSSDGTVRWVISGTWDAKIESAKVLRTSDSESGKPVLETATPKVLWTANKIPPGAEKYYCLSELAVQLNEMEEGIPPTDSRLRPDQRYMEEGRWDEANQEKVRLEEKQRAVRRRREAEIEQALSEGREPPQYQPLWFNAEKNPETGGTVYVFNRKYWDCKARQDWGVCPDIY